MSTRHKPDYEMQLMARVLREPGAKPLILIPLRHRRRRVDAEYFRADAGVFERAMEIRADETTTADALGAAIVQAGEG